MLVVAFALGAALLGAPVHANNIPEPTYDVAVVDGLYAEWDLGEDYFCDMYRDGDPNLPIIARIYLRYDCNTGTMYVLVLSEPNVPVRILPYEVWIQLVGVNGHVFDGDPYNDGPPSDFAWVELTPGSPEPLAWGYEGKFPLFEGIHELIFHMIVYDEGVESTCASAGYPDNGCPVKIDCGVVPAEPSTWGRIKLTY
jgi:hypothetical protein